MNDTQRFGPEDLVRIRRLSGLDVSPEGRWAVFMLDELSEDEKAWDSNLHRLDLDAPGAEPVPLTADTRKKGSPRFRADGRLGLLAEPDPAERVERVERVERTEQAERTEQGREAKRQDAAKGSGAKGSGAKDEGKPKRQLHLLSPTGGAARRLTDLPGGVIAFRWSAGGERLAMLSPVHPEARDLAHEAELRSERRERKSSGVLHEGWPLRFWDGFLGPDFAHLLIAGPDGEEPRDLCQGLGFALHESSLDISPDGASIAVDWREVDEDRRVWIRATLVDAETGARRPLSSGSENTWGARFSPSGRRLAFLSARREPGRTGERDLVLMELETGARRTLASELDLWPESFEWCGDEHLAFTADDQGRHVLRLLEIDSDVSTTLTEAGCVQAFRILPGGESALAILDRFHAPAELCRLDLSAARSPARAPERVAERVPERAPARAPQRARAAEPPVAAALPLTRLNEDRWKSGAASPARSVLFEGADGRQLQAWEMRPPDFDPGRRHPMLLLIHGGPLGSYRDEFHFRWNAALFAAAGYVVVLVNPAGSTGFGQDLIESNHASWGDTCFRDVMAAADHWCAEPWVDETRTAALGASFGGYMVNWIAGRTDRFRCLVCHAGLFHLPAFHGTTDFGPNWEIEFGGPNWDEASAWEAHSPHRQAAEWKTPMLVIHGELDYRVPVGEGLHAYLALQRQGIESRFLYFPDENHWILKPANLVEWNRQVLDWLSRHLAPKGSKGAAPTADPKSESP